MASDNMSPDTPRASNRRRSQWMAFGLVAVTALAGVALAIEGQPSPSAPKPLPSTFDPSALVGEVTANGAVTLATRVDRSRVLKGSDGLVRVELTLSADAAAADVPASEQPPVDVVVVLDHSTSMTGEKFIQAKRALQALVNRLRPVDRLAVVSYGSDAWTSIGLAAASEENKAIWRHTIASLSTMGSTNIAAGLSMAHNLAAEGHGEGRQVRMLLLSDGEPTAGDTSAGGLGRLASLAASRGYVLGTIGVGMGFNEVLMAQLADAGSGNFHSLHNQGDLEGLMAREFDAARATVAAAVAVQLRPPAGVEVVDAAGYPLQKAGDTMMFRPGALFAGQTRSVWVTLKVPTAVEADQALGSVQVSYDTHAGRQALPEHGLPAVACVADQSKFIAGLDQSTWEKSVTDGRFAAVEKEVARLVRAGERQQATQMLDQHISHTSTLNVVVGSAAVDTHLGEARALKRRLDDAFTGADQHAKRNRFSKAANSSGWSRSRAGSLGSR